MKNEPDYSAERKLPDGITCADCRHGPRCDSLFGAIRRGFTSCDFWPSRFAAAEGIEARQGQAAARLDAKHESPVAKPSAQTEGPS